jgi:hypothetical protein
VNAGTTVTAVGEGAFTLAQYASNPVVQPPFASGGQYFDVRVALGSSFSSLEISDCNLGGGTILYWWTGSGWAPVSPQAFTSGPPACATATLSSSSTPTIAQLTGTVFAVALEGKAGAGVARVRGSSARVPISCTGGTQSTCPVALTLNGQKSRAKTVVVGTASATVAAGQSKTVRVSLNRVGKALLARRHVLTAKLTITQSGSVVSTRTITFRTTARRR